MSFELFVMVHNTRDFVLLFLLLQVLLTKPMDLKAAMQAITDGGNAEMAQLMSSIMKLWKQSDPSKGEQLWSSRRRCSRGCGSTAGCSSGRT